MADVRLATDHDEAWLDCAECDWCYPPTGGDGAYGTYARPAVVVLTELRQVAVMHVCDPEALARRAERDARRAELERQALAEREARRVRSEAILRDWLPEWMR